MDPGEHTPDDAWSRPASVRIDGSPPHGPELAASRTESARRALRTEAAASAGWVAAAFVVFAGGFLLWHLLFGAAVGGDVWLGRPLTESAVDGGSVSVGGFPAGSPYVTQTTSRVVELSIPVGSLPRPGDRPVDPSVPDLAATSSGGTDAAATTTVTTLTATAPLVTTTAPTTTAPTTTAPTTTAPTTTMANSRGSVPSGTTAPTTTVVGTAVTSTTVDDDESENDDDSDDDSDDDNDDDTDDSDDDRGGNSGRGGPGGD